jgi:uncharacterized protein with HEPN domain
LPSDRPALRLEDIVDNGRAIQRYVAGMDLAAFEQDRKTYDAIERCLERISEAAAKLGDLAPKLMPDQPWQRIRALGNRLRHEYDSLRADRLWDMCKSMFHRCSPLVRMRCVGWLKAKLPEGYGGRQPIQSSSN